jgi:hypothetical protein
MYHYVCLRARVRSQFGSVCLALLVLSGSGASSSFATSINFNSIFGSSASTTIRVVDSAGPIEVDYDFTGTAGNGLPTIEIKEKLRQPAGGGIELELWSDVEIEICIDKGSDGSVIDGIDDAIDDIKDLIDKIFGSWGNRTSTSSSSINQPPEPDEEVEWDFIDIGVDKFVKNKAGVLFSNYRMVLGTGIGDDFVPSTLSDDLYFLSTPMPKETTDYFLNPPGADGPTSDYLQWTSDGGGAPGLNNYQQAVFWFGIHVPREFFVEDSQNPDKLRARLTIRQHAEIPEPAALTLASIGIIAVSGHLRRRRKNA